MLGSRTITIDKTQFLQGMSSSDHAEDGGFSNRSVNVNLLTEPGTLNATNTYTNDLSASIAGTIVATSNDGNSLGNLRYVLTTTDVAGGDGKYYTVASDYTTTLRQTDTANDYIPENVDMVQYRLEVYTTTETDITLATGTNLTTFDASWWVTTKTRTALNSGNRHPLLVFEGSLWIGDKNLLHKWDGTTATHSFLVLPTEQTITALGIDPGTGKMLISVTEGTNAANTHPKTAKILTYDGFSPKPLRAVIVDDTVNAIYPVGGTVYMTYGQRLGYWTGSGIAFLRRLKNITVSTTTTSADLIYKQRITNIGNTLYVVDGSLILAFGEITNGRKVFYYPLQNNFSAANFIAIFNIGNNRLGVSYAAAKLYTYDMSTASTIASMVLYTNKYSFPQPTIIKTIYLEYSGDISAAASPGSLAIIDENGTATSLESPTNNTSGNIRRIMVHGPDKKVMAMQLLYTASTVVVGLERIVIKYDTVEN